MTKMWKLSAINFNNSKKVQKMYDNSEIFTGEQNPQKKVKWKFQNLKNIYGN